MPFFPETCRAEPQTALFIDFENLYYFILKNAAQGISPADKSIEIIKIIKDAIGTELGSPPIVMAAYADFENGQLAENSVIRSIALLGINVRFALGNQHKNAADMHLSLDVLETMFRNEKINTFFLLAGDRDYIPLVVKLREYGKSIHIISFRGNTSGDLREIVQEGNLHYIDDGADFERRAEEPISPPAPAPVPDLPVLTLTAEEEFEEAVDYYDFESITMVDDEEDEAILSNLLAAYPNRSEIWFVPAKKELAKRMPEFADWEIQKCLNSLKQRGCFSVVKRKGNPNDYSVIIINFDHPDVRANIP
ncbi:MAG: NYN domain-containing protein [Chthonomonas sp.]|nr:NYN domain-containing protein [Chthonomonas sp.]